VRYFNVTGSCDPTRHYMIPAERRLPGLEALIAKGAYFVVHAPRQTGKTTAMKALARRLTAEGRYASLRFSCQNAQVYPDDVGAAEQAVWSEIERSARDALPEPLWPPPGVATAPSGFLQAQLARWAAVAPLPLVLIFDEIDAVAGPSLRSILSQLRTGFDSRPAAFPWSVILCGMRDVRDYKAASGGDPARLGTSSPSNIKEKSLRILDFTEAELRELYAQHTADTGQVFTEKAVERAFLLTQGQPWLCNALAREVIEEIAVPLTEPITAVHVDAAKERLILARATHLDSLLARLREKPVRRILGPVLAGTLRKNPSFDADFEYVTDLGLVAPRPPPRIANPIYQEVILRVLASPVEGMIDADPRSYVRASGRFDLRRLLHDFAEFWRENSEVLTGSIDYRDVAPQLVLMAYLHRLVNGGGYIAREVGVGRKRIDLMVRWSYRNRRGKRAVQREALELKVWRDRDKKGDPLAAGLLQLDAYLARLGLDRGVLVIFDARADAEPVETRTRFTRAVTASGKKVTVLRA
jgi:DNA polymerase III delta prime subunit